MHTASFAVTCTDAREAQILLDSLSVEADDGPDGTQTTLSTDGATLRIRLEGDDLSGLRAAVHSALRLLDAASRVA